MEVTLILLSLLMLNAIFFRQFHPGREEVKMNLYTFYQKGF